MSPTVIAVVPAAGLGLRFRDRLPKALFKFDGKTILVRTIETISSLPTISKIIVLYPSGYQEHFQRETSHLANKIILVEGGQTRQLSVSLGLKHLKQNKHIKDDDIVLVHDAARCLVDRSIIERAIEGANQYGAVSCAVSVVDSLVSDIGEGKIGQYLDRSKYWLIQTPQAFKFSLLFEAHLKASQAEKFDYSDDASLLEGMQAVHIIEGSRSNIKITEKDDLGILGINIQ